MTSTRAGMLAVLLLQLVACGSEQACLLLSRSSLFPWITALVQIVGLSLTLRMRLSASIDLTAFIACLSTCIPSPAVTAVRRCVFLAGPQNLKWIRRAGNISGRSQDCDTAKCCMGYFRVESRKPTPDLLGCSIIQTSCPNSLCHESIHHQNRIGCVCSSDFCNANITFNQQAKQTEYTQPQYSSDLLGTNVLIIPAGALILLFSLIIVLKWKSLLQPCSSVSPPNTPAVSEVSDPDLDKHLKMQEVIARGHFANVCQGTFQGSSVALKVFPSAVQHEFIKEKDVYTLPLMMNSGIVTFLGAGKIGKEYVIVMELATQGSLKAFLSRTVCDWACTLKLARTLSQGLAYLHTDLKMNGVYKPAVAHCDLSSSNVLVRAEGSCALCDFGCATVLQCQALQGYSGRVEGMMRMGTLLYMSPEILEGCVNLSSGRCLLQGDVYSLGLVLWELLMRCADLCEGSPVPEHALPYKTELGCSPSLEVLLTFVSEKRLRPTVPRLWARVSQGLCLQELLEDCWDHDADARLSAECVANRLDSFNLEGGVQI